MMKPLDHPQAKESSAAFNAAGANAPARSPLTLDAKRYDAYFEGVEISEADRRELLETLWKIMVAFVDLGFSVDKLDPIIAGVFAADAEMIHNNEHSDIDGKEHKK